MNRPDTTDHRAQHAEETRIDGAISEDAAGDRYVTWDTQGAITDVGWLSFSTDHGRTWSPPIRVTPDTDNATHSSRPKSSAELGQRGRRLAELRHLGDGG